MQALSFRNDCDDFPDTVIIGLRIEMSVVILNALYKYRLLLLLLLLMHAVLQIALLKTFRCAVGVHFVSNFIIIIVPDLGVLKFTLKTILGV